MVELLRKPIPVGLQKTIADGFSYSGNLKGQEIQYVNMVNALIKPESRIKYELAENRFLKYIYKRRRLSMRNADFFHAVLQENLHRWNDAYRPGYSIGNHRYRRHAVFRLCEA